MFTLVRLLGLTTILALTLGLMSDAIPHNVLTLFNWVSLVYVVGGTTAMLTLIADGPAWSSALRAVLRHDLDAETRRRAVFFFLAASRATLAAGSVAFVIGAIGMLASIGDMSQVGRSLSISLMAVLYALGLSEFLFVPFALALSDAADRREADACTPVATTRSVVIFLPIIVCVGLLGGAVLMLALR